MLCVAFSWIFSSQYERCGLKILRSTLSWTVDWRGSAVASFSALQMKLAPWSPRPTWTRISLRPTPVPSSSSNELALPRKQVTPFNRVFQVFFVEYQHWLDSPWIKSNGKLCHSHYLDVNNCLQPPPFRGSRGSPLQYDPNKPIHYKFSMVQHCNNRSRCWIW